MNTVSSQGWVYSPDPTIERIWQARAELERRAAGDVKRLFELAAREAARALAEAFPARAAEVDAPAGRR